MRHLDLFSGVGGFALAAKWTWGDEYENVGHSEVEKFPCQVYHKHFPESRCLGDITKIDWQEGQADLITGGFPCQPFSVAGKRRGKEDDRHLWPEMLRAIHEVRPRWVIGENVAGIVKMELDNVLSQVEALGYETETFIIPACAVNAPHRRDRVWIIAKSNSSRITQSRIQQSNLSTKSNSKSQHTAHDTKSLELSNSHNQQERLEGRQESSYGIDGEVFGKHWYEVATRLCRMDDGVPRELDFIGGLIEHFSNTKSESEIAIFVGKVLYGMWEYRESATTSPELYAENIHNLVPEVPRQGSPKGWQLGSWQQNDAELCDLWRRFHAEGFPYSQNLQSELLERIRKAKCYETVVKRVNRRVDRLKSLGNAIVPQVAQVIMGAIKQHAAHHLREEHKA